MKTCNPPKRRSVPAIICLTAVLLFFANNLFATIYYVSPTGSDATGAGTNSRPWKSLSKACASVSVPGDIIHVNAGIYTETQQSLLAPGVSIEGDGITSVITSTLTGDWQAIIMAASNVEGTNGNQHISNLKFDGNNITTHVGVVFAARKNVSVYNCTFINFLRVGCSFSGVTGWMSPYAPTVYATGNSFHDNIVTNCSVWITAQAYSTGCVQFGGQDGFLCYNNTITQLSRGAGGQYIGWPLKMANEGHVKNCKVYNNVLTKEPWTGAEGMDNGWNFAAEFWNYEGFEWYGNTIQGTIDLAVGNKGGSAYGLWFHNNTVQEPVSNTHYENGLYMEVDNNDVIVENNIFKNLTCAISMTVHTFPYVGLTNIGVTDITNVVIRNNLLQNIGGDGMQGYGIRAYDSGEPNGNINNWKIYNNTIIGATGSAQPIVGIKIPTAENDTAKNILIANNVIKNFWYTGIYANSGAKLTNLSVMNNDFFNCGVQATFPSAVLSNYKNSGNITAEPNLAVNFSPNVGSPIIDAGINVGLPYSGAAPDQGYVEFQAALPVKLIEFTISQNSGSNILQWKTASEINSSYFVVQRSKDGVVFEDLNSQPASGFSNTIKSYSYTDALPLSGINYYRLILVDKDKREEYSGIIFVRPGYDNSLEIIAARVSSLQNSLAITVSSKQNEKALLHVVDNSGKVLLTQSVLLQKGTNYFDKTMQNVSQGIYYVRLQTATETRVKNILSSN